MNTGAATSSEHAEFNRSHTHLMGLSLWARYGNDSYLNQAIHMNIVSYGDYDPLTDAPCVCFH